MMADSFVMRSASNAMQQHRKLVSSAAVVVHRIVARISTERLQKRGLALSISTNFCPLRTAMYPLT